MLQKQFFHINNNLKRVNKLHPNAAKISTLLVHNEPLGSNQEFASRFPVDGHVQYFGFTKYPIHVSNDGINFQHLSNYFIEVILSDIILFSYCLPLNFVHSESEITKENL